jgi:hypothetical protein
MMSSTAAMRAALGAAFAVAATLSSGCTLRSASGGPTDPTVRARRAAEALERDAFAAARYELYWLAARCEAGDVGRRALLLLAAIELDPNNPYGSPHAAASAAARYLLLPDAEPEQLPLARSLYRIAVDLGGSPSVPGDAPLDGALVAGRYDTCAIGTAVVETPRTLPSTPDITRADRAQALQASLVERADSVESMELRVAAWRARIAELEAELERITALLKEGTTGSSVRGRK